MSKSVDAYKQAQEVMEKFAAATQVIIIAVERHRQALNHLIKMARHWEAERFPIVRRQSGD